MQIEEIQKALAGPQAEKILTEFAQLMDTFLRESGFDQHPVVKGMMAGNTPAQTLGLDRGDLDALYGLGFAALTSGDMQRAQDVFTHLALLDPLEARHRYCLGVIAQSKADYETALDHFTNFLALDATNADGYLRLGETFAALGRKTDARDAFELALAEAQKGNGDSMAVAEARRKLSLMATETRT